VLTAAHRFFLWNPDKAKSSAKKKSFPGKLLEKETKSLVLFA